MIKKHIKGKLCLYLIIFILSGLLIPINVSAQCGDCDDRNPCTKDFCNGTRCEHTPLSCYGGFFQTHGNYESSSNSSMLGKTNSSNITQVTQPERANVVQANVICEDYNPCTIDHDSPAGCIHDPVNCDDGNPCTTDSCGPTGCTHDPVSCIDASEEVRSYCGCPSPQENKEDTSTLETQKKTLFGVQLSLVNNPEGNATQEENERASTEENEGAPTKISESASTEFGSEPEECDCLNDSTLDCCKKVSASGTILDAIDTTNESNQSVMVSESSSSQEPPDCDDGDPCTDDHFVNGKCMHYPKICNDNDPSSYDYCYEGNCVHSQINCDDGDKCTVDSFNGTACVYTPRNCDDGNPCTEDSCNKLAGCQNMEINRDNNYCTIECENGQPVNKMLICDDGNPCTIDYCDKSIGCVHVPICGPFYYGYHPSSHYPYMDYYYPPGSAYYPYGYNYPKKAPVVVAPPIAAPAVTAPAVAAPGAAGTSSNPQTKSYTISAGTVITLPWNDTITALDTLQVENGVAFSSGSGIRFARQMGASKVYQLPGDQNITDRAEMVGLSWPVDGSPFTLALTQPNGTILSVQDYDENALHLTGSNYDYYFLRNPAKGYWNVVVTPAQSVPNGIGFSLISGLVEGIVPPDKS